MRPRRNGRAIQPAQHSPSSTASVALWVEAAKAVKANSEHFSMAESVAVQDQDEQRQHRQAGKNVGQQRAGEPGQRRGQDQRDADRVSRNGRSMPSTRSVSCRIHSVASAWMPRLIQKDEPSPKCR